MAQMMMEQDKQRKAQLDEMANSHKQGTIWRSATTNQPIQGYSKAVLDSMKNPGRPPVATAKDARNPFVSGITPNQRSEQEKASINLQKELVRQNNEQEAKSSTQASTNDFPEVEEFLASINLQKYKDRLIENGIEDQETILELNDQHLDAIGIPLGYKLKIIKRIKTIRQEKGMSVPESR